MGDHLFESFLAVWGIGWLAVATNVYWAVEREKEAGRQGIPGTMPAGLRAILYAAEWPFVTLALVLSFCSAPFRRRQRRP